jgi:hypothetical protein
MRAICAERGSPVPVNNHAARRIDHDNAIDKAGQAPQQLSHSLALFDRADLGERRNRSGRRACSAGYVGSNLDIAIYLTLPPTDVRAGKIQFDHLRAGVPRFSGERAKVVDEIPFAGVAVGGADDRYDHDLMRP